MFNLADATPGLPGREPTTDRRRVRDDLTRAVQEHRATGEVHTEPEAFQQCRRAVRAGN